MTPHPPFLGPTPVALELLLVVVLLDGLLVALLAALLVVLLVVYILISLNIAAVITVVSSNFVKIPSPTRNILAPSPHPQAPVIPTNEPFMGTHLT